MDIIGYAKSHPWIIAGGLFAAGVVFLLLNSGGGGGTDPGLAAFYAAQAAQKTSGDQVQIAQIGANAQTTTSLAYIDAQKSINTTWANEGLALANANNAAAVNLAPFRVQDDYIQAITTIASQPQQVVTNTSSRRSSGFFGIGGGTRTTTTQTIVPNPGWDLLHALAGSFSAPPPLPHG